MNYMKYPGSRCCYNTFSLKFLDFFYGTTTVCFVAKFLSFAYSFRIWSSFWMNICFFSFEVGFSIDLQFIAISPSLRSHSSHFSYFLSLLSSSFLLSFHSPRLPLFASATFCCCLDSRLDFDDLPDFETWFIRAYNLTSDNCRPFSSSLGLD